MMTQTRKTGESVPLEVLDFAFVLLGSASIGEGAEVTTFAGVGVDLAGVEAVLAGFEFADHIPSGS